MISLIGDIAATGLISSDSKNNHKRFIYVHKLLTEKMLVFANLEVPIKSKDSVNEYKNFVHYSTKEPTLDLLKFLNIKETLFFSIPFLLILS